ncbi:probable fatty acid-binding protein isoform X1 [Chrysoperla carnea]|uniref:probable fatty acid-binding protein isoform X1 n=1 Tax=Chrysoperla carnea TaxID=189513 RepID=UPI001D06B05E|nr:probable fatty acid-binding protein isoform X1 [Chrysoperla carnea]
MAKLEEVFNKKYQLSSSENFDDYMKAVGVGLVTRKMGNAVSPVVELTKNDDEYTLTSSSTFKNVVLKFKPDVEFDQETPDGRKVKALIKIDGNKLIETQKDGSGKETLITREFTPDQVKMVMTVDNVTATRIYSIVA